MQRVAIERMEILLLQSRYKRQNGQRKGTLGQAGLNGRANGLNIFCREVAVEPCSRKMRILLEEFWMKTFTKSLKPNETHFSIFINVKKKPKLKRKKVKTNQTRIHFWFHHSKLLCKLPILIKHTIHIH